MSVERCKLSKEDILRYQEMRKDSNIVGNIQKRLKRAFFEASQSFNLFWGHLHKQDGIFGKVSMIDTAKMELVIADNEAELSRVMEGSDDTYFCPRGPTSDIPDLPDAISIDDDDDDDSPDSQL